MDTRVIEEVLGVSRERLTSTGNFENGLSIRFCELLISDFVFTSHKIMFDGN